MSKATKQAAKKNGTKGQKSAPAPKALQKASQKPQAVTVKAVKTAETPYRKGSNYQAIVETLQAAKGKPIDFAALKAGVKEAMGDGWTTFAKREGRNENAKDTDARLHQNVGVLQRKNDYAKPLVALGLEIVKVKDEKRGWLYSLVKIGK